jgi:hypothetical protein
MGSTQDPGRDHRLAGGNSGRLEPSADTVRVGVASGRCDASEHERDATPLVDEGP